MSVVASVGVGAQMGWLALVGIGLYMLLAMKRFYGQDWIKALFKFSVVSFIFFFLVLIPVLFVVITVRALES